MLPQLGYASILPPKYNGLQKLHEQLRLTVRLRRKYIFPPVPIVKTLPERTCLLHRKSVLSEAMQKCCMQTWHLEIKKFKYLLLTFLHEHSTEHVWTNHHGPADPRYHCRSHNSHLLQSSIKRDKIKQRKNIVNKN